MRKLFSLALAAVLSLALAPTAAHAATDVTGAWSGSVSGGGGDFQLTFNLKQSGATLTGTIDAGQGDPLPITNGKIDGDKISFEVNFNGTTITHEGTISADEIKLTSKSSDGNFPASTLTLKRAKAPAAQ